MAAGELNQRCTASASSGRKSLSEIPRAISACPPAPARPPGAAGSPGTSRRTDPLATLPGATEQGGRCLGEDPQVEPERTVLDVPDVELDPLLPGDPGATVDLGPAGHAGAQIEPPALTRRVELDLGGQGRARPDDPHLAAQHVDQVGQLVERVATEEPADTRHPGVVGRHRRADSDRVGSLPHRPQLVELEDPTVPADAALAIEDRPRRLQPDRDRGGEQQRRDQDEADDGDREVGRPRQALARSDRGLRDVQPLLRGVGNRRRRRSSRPLHLLPADRYRSGAEPVPEPDCDRGGHGHVVVGDPEGQDGDESPESRGRPAARAAAPSSRRRPSRARAAGC